MPPADEIRHVEEQILVGEVPDPTRIPSGCRFHPRCPVLRSGESSRLGIEGRCRGEEPTLLPVADAATEALQLAACHAVPATVTAAVAG